VASWNDRENDRAAPTDSSWRVCASSDDAGGAHVLETVSDGMGNAQGFWSYAHRDDEAEAGRISQLARDVVAQYEMITGEAIELFLDRDSLEWGDEWQAKVDASLASVAFFIPVLTPRYFQSAECRRELNVFARLAERLGVRELVMPILYIDVPALHDDPPEDETMVLVKSFQWESWVDLRFADSASSEYRRAVAKLARRLADANALAERTDVSAAAIALSEGDDDQELGVLDLMARAEEAMPQWSETMQEITREIENISTLAQATTAEMAQGDKQGKGFAARLTAARRMAKELDGPAQRIDNLGEQFARQLYEIDQGVRLLIERLPGEVEEDPEGRESACEFFQSVRLMADSAEEGLGALKGMVDAMSPIEGMSRDLRPRLRKLNHGLTLMYEGRNVIRSWVAQIEASPLDCEVTINTA
jgi:hypothetical protein